MPDQKNDVRKYRNTKKTTSFDEMFEESFDRSSGFKNQTPVFSEDQGAFSMSESSFRHAFDTDSDGYGSGENRANPFSVRKKVKSVPTADASKSRARSMEVDRFFMEDAPDHEVDQKRFEDRSPIEVDFSQGPHRGVMHKETSSNPALMENWYDDRPAQLQQKSPVEKPTVKKEKKMRAGLFQYGVAAFGMTLIALIFILLVNLVGSFSSETLHYTLKQAGEIPLTESTCVWVKDQTIVTADSNSVNAYNTQRSLLWNYNCALSDPRLAFNDQYAVLYDAIGTDYILMNQTGVLYNHASDGRVPILKAMVNHSGYVVLICGTEESQQLQIFSPSGDLLLRRSTKPDTSGALLDAYMSDDEKYLVTLSIQYSDSSSGSQITVYNLNQSGNGLSDTINSNFVFDDTLMFTLIPMNRGVAVLGDNRILGYASGNTWKENWNERLTNRIVSFSASGDALALTYGNELTPVSSGLEGKTVVYAYGGDLLSAPEDEITYFQIEDQFEVYQQNGIYYCTNTKDKIFWSFSTEEEVVKVYRCADQWVLQTGKNLKVMNPSVLDS